MSWTYYPESYQAGELIFTDFCDPIHEGTKLWLLCEDYQQSGEDENLYEYLGTTAVELH